MVVQKLKHDWNIKISALKCNFKNINIFTKTVNKYVEYLLSFRHYVYYYTITKTKVNILQKGSIIWQK